ncbi:MAG: Smr/MutS family protein, partial [Rhizobiaceae bacterium]
MTRPPKVLSNEDRILWNLVARSTKPLPGKSTPVEPAAAESFAEAMAETEKRPAPAATPASTSPQPKRHLPTHLDTPTLDKLAKGRLPIEARVDLHGMTQDEAYSLLYTFLSRAHSRGARYVLVITGKGSSSGGDGILKRMVPGWLSTPTFRPFVSSHDHAARGHGGGGALY